MSAVSHVCNFAFEFGLNVKYVRDLGFHSGDEDASLPDYDVVSFGRVTVL